jgi:carboxyl-terminal processing protease
MQIKQFWGRLRTKRVAYGAGITVGVLVIFICGVLTGDGRLRIVPVGDFSSVTGLPNSLDYSSVNQLYDTIRANYDGKLTESQILDGIKHGLANAANDPYTVYFTPKEANAFNGELQGISLTGIGAELDQDAAGDVVVMSPLDGSPAAQAGVLAKDVIATINGQSTSGMSVNDAVNKIRGPKGSKVSLGIIRGGSQQLNFTITRAAITVPTATSKILADNVGYLQVSQFSDDTFNLVQQAVSTFEQKGVKKIVLDLRDDPGGEVDTAKNIASLWLPENTLIMQEKRGSKVVDSYRSTGHDPLKGMPTVVLVNNGSASASEITALALRDNKAATIIGQKSYGKGVVQSVIPFADGTKLKGELKVTIAKWYSPNDTSINKKGITPDQVVPLSDADAKAGTDTQLNAALDYLQIK